MSKKRREIPIFHKPVIETHCHLDYLQADSISTLIQQAQAVGVERFITIAVSAQNLQTVVAIADQHSAVWGTQGIHPHEAAQYNRDIEQTIISNSRAEKIVAIGEIGLDYYYDHADRSVQRNVFERQLQIAIDQNLPVVIHTREAEADTRSILANFAGQLHRKGVIHSFTSSLTLAEFCLEQGFYLGFNGIATFNKADNVRAVIAATPAERILLETDAPYLTPVPYRGRENAPCYLPFIAEKIANVKQIDIEDLLESAYRSSNALFFD
jgi:TatD DNase family protein